MLRDALLLAIRESEGVTFADAKARDAFVDNLLNAMAVELFGEGAKTGDPASPSRALVDLYENCAEWTEGACDVQALNLTGPAVELGDADWLTWEVAEGEDSRPTLGYTMPDVDRFYYHQLPPETRVFVLPSGALVVTHPDLMLTAQGLDEPSQYAEETQYGMDPEYDPPRLIFPVGTPVRFKVTKTTNGLAFMGEYEHGRAVRKGSVGEVTVADKYGVTVVPSDSRDGEEEVTVPWDEAVDTLHPMNTK